MNIAMNPNAYWLAVPLMALLVFTPLRTRQRRKDCATKGAAGGRCRQLLSGRPKVLSAMIDGFLAKVSGPPVTDPILAVVAPHAGYEYSGPVAAYTYAAVEGTQVHARRGHCAVALRGLRFHLHLRWRRLRNAAGQRAGGQGLRARAGQDEFDACSSRARARSAHRPSGEHSVEVQLPWLQKVLGNFEIVPIVMGDQSYESSRALGVALAKLIKSEGKEGETLVLASSDLSHYHPYDDAETIDHKTLNALQVVGLLQHVAQLPVAHLGGLRRRAHRGRNDLRRAHGSQPGAGAEVREFRRCDRRSFARGRLQRGCFCEGVRRNKAEETPFSLSEQEKSELLALARKSVEYVVQKG